MIMHDGAGNHDTDQQERSRRTEVSSGKDDSGRDHRKGLRCQLCGKKGHGARDCWQSSAAKTEVANNNTFEHGAVKKETTRSPGVDRQRGSKIICFQCGEEGHIARNCPELQKERESAREQSKEHKV